MAKKTTKITDFQETGMNPDIRGSSGASLIEHFNVDYASTLEHSWDFTVSTHPTATIQSLALIDFTLAAGGLYGVGVRHDDSAKPAVYKWSSDNYRWEDHFNFTGNGSADKIVYYQDNFYGYVGTKIWTNTLAGGSLNESWKTFTGSADPVHHTKDDTLYFFSTNVVASLNGVTWAAAALTLPADFTITTASEYGNYLAIGGYDSNSKRSTVFLWDRDSGLTTLTERYDWGAENLKHIAVLEGSLVGVSLSASSVNSSVSERILMTIKRLVGGAPLVINQFKKTTITIGGKFVHQDKLYFGLSGFETADRPRFVACVDGLGRLFLEQKIHDADISTGLAPTAVYTEGEGWWATAQDSSDKKAYHTSSAVADIASYETLKYTAKDFINNLDFVGATIMTEPLPTAGQIILKSRKDEETAWTTLATFTTDNALKHSVVKKGCETIPSIGKEVQFRIESTGGANITGFQVTFDEVKSQAYG